MPVSPHRDRMFHVIVMGGIGLVPLAGCGATAPEEPVVTSDDGAAPAPKHDGGAGHDAFPDETKSYSPDAFPSEGFYAPADAYTPPHDEDAFPDETGSPGAPLDASRTQDAGVDSGDDCFPEETAVTLDASLHCPRTRGAP